MIVTVVSLVSMFQLLQDENEFFNLLVAGVGEALARAEKGEATFFQDTEGGEIVFGNTGVDRTCCNVLQKCGEGGSGNALAPEGFAYPVANFWLGKLFIFIAEDMTRHLSREQDRFDDDGFVAQNPPPMQHEGISIGWVLGGEGGHVVCVHVQLLVEEDAQIAS